MHPLDRLASLDALLRHWIVLHRAAGLNGVMVTLSAIGRGGMVWLAAGAALAIARRITLGALIRLALAILLSATLTDRVIKPLVHRPRPFTTSQDAGVLGPVPEDASFPSGHSANAFAGALVLVAETGAMPAVWFGLAAAIAFSRVYVGVHYPLDVIGGALVGLLSAAVVLRSWTALAPRLARKI